jgi:hypothetical protein
MIKERRGSGRSMSSEEEKAAFGSPKLSNGIKKSTCDKKGKGKMLTQHIAIDRVSCHHPILTLWRNPPFQWMKRKRREKI